MWKTCSAIVLILLASALTRAQDATTKPSTFHLNLSFEDLADAPPADKSQATISMERGGKKPKEEPAKLVEGDNEIHLVLPDGTHYLYIRCPGFAAQHVTVKVEDGELKNDSATVTLYHTRYVIIRYSFNKKGKRELTGNDVESGKLALTHWTGLPHFGEDWQLWQAETNTGGGFGAIPVLAFHRSSTESGLADVPENSKFEDLTEAPKPSEGGYQCKSTEATPGLMRFCRIQGNDGNLGFGKILVEDVTLTPPKDVKVLADR